MKSIFALLLCFLVYKSQASTPINGIIKENTTLTKAGSPYQFGKVLVPVGVVLTVEAGVEINISFNNNNNISYDNSTQLLVEGQILMNGTISEPITVNGNIKVGYDPTRGGKKPEQKQAISAFSHCNFSTIHDYCLYGYHVPLKINDCRFVGRISITMSESSKDNDSSEVKNTNISNGLNVHGGKVLIENCKLYRGCAFSAEIICKNNIFNGENVNGGTYNVFVATRKAVLIGNTFEQYPESALFIYLGLGYGYTIQNNVFKHNFNNFHIKCIDIASNNIAKTISPVFVVENNEFHEPASLHILVDDNNAQVARGEFHTLSLKNNFWANEPATEVQQRIYDNNTDFQLRIRIDVSPVLQTSRYTPPVKVIDETMKPLPTAIKKPALPYHNPIVYSVSDHQKIDTTSYLSYTFDEHSYKLPMMAKTEIDLFNTQNAYSKIPTEQRHLVYIKRGKKFATLDYLSITAYDPDKTMLLAIWNIQFQSLNFDKIYLPYKVTSINNYPNPYIQVFMNYKDFLFSDFVFTITKIDDDYMYGTIEGKARFLDKSEKPLLGQFKFKLNYVEE
jgi:hypothetical protein